MKLNLAHQQFLMDYIRSYSAGMLLTEDALCQIVRKFQINTYANKERFSEQGNVSNTVGVLYSGLFKITSVNKNGEDYLRDFCFAPYNPVVGDWDSMMSHLCSAASICSRRTSEVIMIYEEDLNLLCNQFPHFNMVCKCMMSNSGKARKELLVAYEDYTSIEKRSFFMIAYPLSCPLITQENMTQYFGLSKNALT